MTRFTQEFYDRDTGTLRILHTEDVEPLLDENAGLRNSGVNGFSKSRNWRKIGSIPCVIVEKILREHGVNILDGSPEAQKYIRKFLNNNKKLMTVDRL
jgi:hypothetical protein